MSRTFLTCRGCSRIFTLQWQQVLDCISHEEDWQGLPLLIFRYAEACFKLKREQTGIENWLRLFILFPSVAELQIASTGNRFLAEDWQDFNALDAKLEASNFPAWMVLKRPVYAKLLENLDCDNVAGELMQLIAELVAGSSGSINTTAIQQRTRLQQLNPTFFKLYMSLNK